MKWLLNIKIALIITALLTNDFVFSQSTMLAYNDGLPTVTISSGIVVTIQGGYMSQTKSSVDGKMDNQGTMEVSGDFINNNAASDAFSSNAGLVHLNGSTEKQNINGTYDPGFYDLMLTNTYSVFPQLAMNLSSSVKNTLTMSTGSMNLISNILTLGTSASSAGALSYVAGMLYDGTFKRWFGTSSFSIANSSGHFPMGTYTAEYRPLWMAASSNLTSGGTVSVLHTPNYPAGTISASHTDASWGQTLAGVSRSSWTVSTANSFAFNGSTGMIRFGGAGFTQFVLTDLNASLISSVVGTHAASTSINTSLEVNRTGLSTVNMGNAWKIGSKDITTSPLPVELLSFDAKPNGSVVEVNWSTASEINSDYFMVQRSKDGLDFQDVLQRTAAGNSTIVINYSAVDYEPYDGVSYYRLKEVDFNGSFQYSNIVAVEFHKASVAMDIYPNPSNGDFYITVNGEKGDKFFIMVHDMLGQQLYFRKIVLENKSLVQPLNLASSLTPGIYIATAANDEHSVSKKIVIK